MVEMIKRVENMPEVMHVIVDVSSVDCAGVDAASCDGACVDIHYILDIVVVICLRRRSCRLSQGRASVEFRSGCLINSCTCCCCYRPFQLIVIECSAVLILLIR